MYSLESIGKIKLVQSWSVCPQIFADIPELFRGKIHVNAGRIRKNERPGFGAKSHRLPNSYHQMSMI